MNFKARFLKDGLLRISWIENNKRDFMDFYNFSFDKDKCDDINQAYLWYRPDAFYIRWQAKDNEVFDFSCFITEPICSLPDNFLIELYKKLKYKYTSLMLYL